MKHVETTAPVAPALESAPEIEPVPLTPTPKPAIAPALKNPMQIADCWVWINKETSVKRSRFTPAEVVAFRTIHRHNVGKDPITGLVIVGQIDRDSATERQRLRQTYFAKDKKGNSIVDGLWPGATPTLPSTFDGIWPEPAQVEQRTTDEQGSAFNEAVHPLTESEEIQSLQNP